MATKTKKKKERLDLSSTLAEITRTYGDEVVVTDTKKLDALEFISTGLPQLDRALNGGYPKGRIIEIYGIQSGGKTTTAYLAIANLQKTGGKSVFVDAEKAFSPDHARLQGVNPDDTDTFILVKPEYGEQALDTVERIAATGEVDFIVIDSISALVPEAELEGEMGDAVIGLQARMMSQAMRKLVGILEETGTTLFLINQLREKVGVVFGNPEVTSGGKAVGFYASVRMRISISERKPGEYIKAKLKLDKSKVSSPFQEVEFTNYMDRGVSPGESLLDAAVDAGVIKKAGGYLQSIETGENGKPLISRFKKDWAQILESNEEEYQNLYQKAIIAPIEAERQRIRELGNIKLQKQSETIDNFDPETGEVIDG